MNSDAWELGKSAFLNASEAERGYAHGGKVNPFPKNSSEYKEWFRGYWSTPQKPSIREVCINNSKRQYQFKIVEGETDYTRSNVHRKKMAVSKVF